MICEEIKNAEKLLQQAKIYMNDQDFKNAIKVLDEGTEIIGDQYSSPNLRDSTNMKRIAAIAEEGKGNLEVASNLKYNVLNARIELAKQKFNCE